ncbi:plakophilin-1 [Cololabis saira]|uniref:plakophilin-1 n=1 Tax=Cololabis saira TaxID=129043 RepID=UPI002AD46EB9|nr:plakophilin-1 [Cololabis saira]
MTSADPLKTVISIGNVDDTSLALPSLNQYRSGQQRVMEQVRTIRRTKSRPSSSRSASGASASLSPTSPSYDPVFLEKSSTSNGNVFFVNGVSKNFGVDKTVSRPIVNNSQRSSVSRHSTYYHERDYAPFTSCAVAQNRSSRSEPDLGWRFSVPQPSLPPQRIVSNQETYLKKRSTSQFITNTMSKPQVPVANGSNLTKSNSQFLCSRADRSKTSSRPSITEATPKTGINGNGGVTDITMKEAVEFLSSEDEKYQFCGASYIQHNTFLQDKAKEEVLQLNGIPPLVALLHASSSQVSQTATAALRNLAFKNDKNKEEIRRCGGITEAVAQLRDSDSLELHKQLTGLLWNLSSADNLRPDLLKIALPALVERVILPYTATPKRSNDKSRDPDVFFHTTGCLKNLSSAKQSSRQAMRKCRGLVDSLVSYIKDRVDAEKPDDESVENCMCILHNLTFQLEAEAPALFSRITALAKTVIKNQGESNASPVGCFSAQSKVSETERHFDFPVVEDPHPTGAGWLIHSKTLQSYLSLLGSSQREETQEVCCGTLLNLTAHEGIVPSVMSQIIVQKLNGLPVITPLIKSDKVNLQKSAVGLLGNLTKNPNLHSAIARKSLPPLLGLLGEGTKEGNESDDTLAMACQSASSLLMKEPEMSKTLLTNNLVKSLNDLSQNIYFPKSRKAAALLLYKIWSDKDLQSFLKKQGMNKSSFVNDITVAAQRSAQVVE